ncbi:LacI family DNA-binding transcriptional regulator [Natronospirillum operosum]|uniref:LacI family DNA-binding transcriptional regulator n=1 Tax=Natronospirillum operosum TaxID=2759953 RepID=A0A4Z0WF03_9GAMM|nr:LacI family DNA-binding transcriptional regulator [Natronospirillum operosum]TGG95198.1 LacI family DNA-binding transcriptional regulator [Natronospirillum operosum]
MPDSDGIRARDLIRRFSLKRIAAQAGVSRATVDRALHGRGQVHQQTQQRIRQALHELEVLDEHGLAAGQTLHLDLIMAAPQRFSRQVRQALTGELLSLAPFRISPRFHFFEQIETQALIDVILRCHRRGTHGIVLKAPDEPGVTETVNQICAEGTPVLTLVTDLPASRRLHYIGMDNRAAGQTAAYLFDQWLPAETPVVAVNIGSLLFRGEEEREMGFRTGLRARRPGLEVVDIVGGYGLHAETLAATTRVLQQQPDLAAVYNVGGANGAILEAFADARRSLRLLVGHDLDADNRVLLRQERLQAVIDHDLRADMRHACLRLLVARRLMRPEVLDSLPAASPIQVVTPPSLPAGGAPGLQTSDPARAQKQHS